MFRCEDVNRASMGEDRVLSLKFRKSFSKKVMLKLISEWRKSLARTISSRITFCVEGTILAETVSKREREK